MDWKEKIKEAMETIQENCKGWPYCQECPFSDAPMEINCEYLFDPPRRRIIKED